MSAPPRRLAAAIAAAQSALDKAALHAIVDSVSGARGEIVGEYRFLALSLFLAGLIVAPCLFSAHAFLAGTLAAAATVVALVRLVGGGPRRSLFVEAVLLRAAMIDHGLVPRDRAACAVALRDWRTEFPEFELGEDQHIACMATGTWSVGVPGIADQEVALYRFCYTGGDDSVRTRFGVVASLPAPAGIAMSTVRKPRLPEPFRTNDVAFDARFRCASTGPRALRAVTRGLLDRLGAFERVTDKVDVHMGGRRVCLSFDTSDLFRPPVAAYTHDALRLKARIDQRGRLPRYEACLEVLQAIAPSVLPDELRDALRRGGRSGTRSEPRLKPPSAP